MDPDFIKPVESQGESVTIRENSREKLQLKMILRTPHSRARKEEQRRAING
jgi:hypothetical protein